MSSPDLRYHSQSPNYYRQSNDFYGGMGTRHPDYYGSVEHQPQHNNWQTQSGNYEDTYQYQPDQADNRNAAMRMKQQPKSGDVLDKYGHHFTPGGEFQPRILQRQTSSKLSQTKFYNPPKSANNRSRSEVDTERKQEPREGENTMLFNETLMSRDGRENRTPKDVPGLNITCDEDNLKWQQQQKHQHQNQSQKQQSQQQKQSAWKTMGEGSRRQSRMESITETMPREPDTAVYMATHRAGRKPFKTEDESK